MDGSVQCPVECSEKPSGFMQKQNGISLSDKQLPTAQGKSYTIELSNKDCSCEILSI